MPMATLRKHQTTIVWVICLVIIPVFGIGGLLASLAGHRADRVVGTVDGRSVRESELQAFIARHRLQLGRDLDPDTIFSFYVGVIKARRLGFKVSDQEIVATMLQYPVFHGADGAFDPVRYREFLSNAGMTDASFTEGLRDQLLLDKFGMGRGGLLVQPVPVTRADVLFAFHEQKDRYKIKTAGFPLEDLAAADEPGYSDAKQIYTEAESRLERGEDPSESEFFKTYPIVSDLRKEWVVVQYLAVLWSEIEPLLEVADDTVAVYYNEHRDLYRVEAPPPAEGQPAPAVEPRYKTLDEVRDEVRAALVGQEARRIAELLRNKIRDAKNAAEFNKLTISFAELARPNYLAEITPGTGFALKNGRAVATGISDPVNIPRSPYMPLIIDRRIGMFTPSFSREAGRTDFDRALEALQSPDPDVPTGFLEAQNGYCIFVPVWWPNKDLGGERRADLTFKVPFPRPETVESDRIKEDTKPLEATVEEIGSLLDIKVENATVNAGVALYQRIMKQLRNERMRENARKRAEALLKDITPDTFDRAGIDAKAVLTTLPFQNIEAGGGAVTACFHLVPAKAVSDVFEGRGDDGKAFFGVGMLLEQEIADNTALQQEEYDRIRATLERTRQRDYLTLIEIANDLKVSLSR